MVLLAIGAISGIISLIVVLVKCYGSIYLVLNIVGLFFAWNIRKYNQYNYN